MYYISDAVALLLLQLALQVSAIPSHSPLDLLALPAYAVQFFPDRPISNSSAQAVLARTHDTVAGQEHEPGRGGIGKAGIDVHSPDPKPYLLRSADARQAYLCTVPQVASDSPSRRAADNQEPQQQLTVEEKAAKRQRNEVERQQAFERGISLLEPLKGHCLYLTQGWFTYAFCHGSEIRQFHGIRVHDTKGPGIAEDPTQDSYTLGLFSHRIVRDEKLVNSKKARALGSLREILDSDDKSSSTGMGIYGQDADDEDVLGDHKRYLVQSWSGGTMCDKTGVQRRIEVQFHCNSQSSDRIFLIRETAICEYVMVIHTPRLCGEPIFGGGSNAENDAASERRRKETSIIECRPIVNDETLLLQSGETVKPGLPATEISSQTAAGGETIVDRSRNEIPTDGGASETSIPTSNDAAAAKRDSQTSATKEDPPLSNTDGDFYTDNYVLVVDPVTGQIVLGTEEDPDGVSTGLGSEALSGNLGDESDPATAQLMQMLQKSIETIFHKAMQDASSDQAAAADDKSQSTVVDDSEDSKNAKPGFAILKDQQRKNPLSRLNKVGAHNHRAVAEQFLRGQLEQGKRLHRDQKVAGSEKRELGSAQYKDLKRTFGTAWGDGEQEKEVSAEEKQTAHHDRDEL